MVKAGEKDRPLIGATIRSNYAPISLKMHRLHRRLWSCHTPGDSIKQIPVMSGSAKNISQRFQAAPLATHLIALKACLQISYSKPVL